MGDAYKPPSSNSVNGLRLELKTWQDTIFKAVQDRLTAAESRIIAQDAEITTMKEIIKKQSTQSAH